MIDLYFESEPIISPGIWKPALIKASIRAGLKGKDLSISFVEKETISKLNKKHLRRDFPTDVLSFPLGPGKGGYGEIVVCSDVVRENAAENKLPFEEELLRVIVHGLLHLKGYKHEPIVFGAPGISESSKLSANELVAKKMFDTQEAIVQELWWDIFDPLLIVGLGNPGENYDNNRHNAGFMLFDRLTTKLKKISKERELIASRHGAEFAKYGKQHSYCLIKPLVGMNRVGSPVKAFVKELAIDPRQSLLVIHDDLDLELGKYKFSYGKGRLHKGIKDVELKLKTTRFWRLRVGIENRDPKNRVSGAEYVLTDFSAEEIKVINGVVEEASAEVFKKIKLALA